jgi:hypothetical protein
MRRIAAALLLGGVLITACGGDTLDDAAEVPLEPSISDGLPLADDAATMSDVGPGISLDEALAATPGEPLLVNGYVFVYDDGTVVFADLIAESFPPQPAGAMVTVEGLDLMNIPLTEGPTDTEIAITAWTDSPVQLVGAIVDGVFVGDSVASA